MASSNPISSVESPELALPPSSPLSHLSTTPSPPSSPENMLLPTRPRKYVAPRCPIPTSLSSAVSETRPAPVEMKGSQKREAEERSSSLRCAKKRKLTPPKEPKEPKERTTEYLDLMKPYDEWTAHDETQQTRLLNILRKKKKIVVIAGAGISVSAGIPDFRSATGLFANPGNQQNKMRASGKHLFDASVYKDNASTQSFHTMVRDLTSMSREAKPTMFHQMVASLAKEKRLLRLYTQNIDCIDTSLEPLATQVPLPTKGPWPRTIQLHGGLQKMVCTKCGELRDFEAEIFHGPEAPLCETCTKDDEVRTAFAGKRSLGIGRLRPRFVLYNEPNPDQEAIGNVIRADLKAKPDAVIVVGTTLKVPGARNLVKDMCQIARSRRGGLTCWVNLDSEPKSGELKDCWDLVVRARCDEVARQAALPPWDCYIGNDYLVPPEDHDKMEELRKLTTLEVGIRSTSSSPLPVGVEAQLEEERAKGNKIDNVLGMPTPRPSPKPSAVEQEKKKKKTTATKSTKQAKLPFAKTVKEEAAEDAPPKKQGRPTKTKQTKKKKTVKDARPQAAVGVASILQDIKVKKVVNAHSAEKTAKLGKAEAVPEKVFSLPSLRPTKPDSGGSVSGDSGIGMSSSSSSSRPSTPPQSCDVQTTTISPKSVPRAMERLIDV